MTSSTSKRPTPLPLPKVTFLTGGSDRQRELLATAIANLDPEMLIDDLESSIRQSSHVLFCGCISNDGKYPKNWPGFSISFEQWMSGYIDFIREELGEDGVGMIALQELKESLGIIYDRCIYRDLKHLSDVNPFALEYGPRECCVIHLGMTPAATLQDVHHIWLAMPEVHSQIELLRHELEPVR